MKISYNGEDISFENYETCCKNLSTNDTTRKDIIIDTDFRLENLLEATIIYNNTKLKENDKVTIKDDNKDTTVEARVKEVKEYSVILEGFRLIS